MNTTLESVLIPRLKNLSLVDDKLAGEVEALVARRSAAVGLAPDALSAVNFATCALTDEDRRYARLSGVTEAQALRSKILLHLKTTGQTIARPDGLTDEDVHFARLAGVTLEQAAKSKAAIADRRVAKR